MKIKRYTYTATDGIHWPDAFVGEDAFYSIDFTNWLSKTNDEVLTATWELPEGITSFENFISNNKAIIKLNTQIAGTYEIICSITSTDVSRTQTTIIPMMLKVI